MNLKVELSASDANLLACGLDAMAETGRFAQRFLFRVTHWKRPETSAPCYSMQSSRSRPVSFEITRLPIGVKIATQSAPDDRNQDIIDAFFMTIESKIDVRLNAKR